MDVSAGVVTGCILAIDQGMIMAAIANELADDAMQHAFSDGPIEKIIRPLVAMEEFSAGPSNGHIGPIAGGGSTLRFLDDLKTRAK